MSKRTEVTLKIMATTEELVKVIRVIKKCLPQTNLELSEGDKWVAEQICFHASEDDKKRLNECYAQTDCEAFYQFDDSEAQDIVLNQMEEAMDRGADPFPMMDDEGIKSLEDFTIAFTTRVIPIQDLIQAQDVYDSLREVNKGTDTEVIYNEYKKVCYVPKEIQEEDECGAQPFGSLFLADVLLPHFYPDDRHIRIRLTNGYIPQVFVIGEYDESNEGYSAELRVRDKNEKGKYEAIRGFVKPKKPINSKLFC